MFYNYNKINHNNKQEVDDMYIHDSKFTGYLYDYDKRQISFSCNNIFLKKEFSFLFQNVILCEMQSCSFWHGGDSILVISLVDNPPQLKQLMKVQSENQELYRDSYLDKGISYLSVQFEMNSGDTLLIICESFDWREEDL